ncbi:MAG: sensor histidine kinase [Eggerthellales bacterium]|nr:sensor histidine kinase [Eggerthellales bacterium]
MVQMSSVEASRSATDSLHEAPSTYAAAFDSGHPASSAAPSAKALRDLLIHDVTPSLAEAEDAMTLKDWVFDVACALVCFGFACMQLYLGSSSVYYIDGAERVINLVPNTNAYVAAAFATLPMVLRRGAPWPMFVVVTACFVAVSFNMTTYSISVIGIVVGIYTIARYRGLRQGGVATGIAALAMALTPVLSGAGTLSLVLRAENVLLVVAGYGCGLAVRVFRAYLDQSQLALDRQRQAHEELMARRVAEERVRIARDVHDITGHSLSAVAIQAAAAERMVDIDPAAAKEAIREIRQLSKGSLEEIRSLVGVLREGDPAQTSPAEGTERLPDLVSYLRRGGVSAVLDASSYDRGSTPAFVDMALFSLAREAATNTLRHAGATSVRICLSCDGCCATLRYQDDGCGFSPEALVGADGHGLSGMAERVEALHGTLDIQSQPQEGFAMTAIIPLEGATHA